METAAHPIARRDSLWAAAAGCIAFGVYLRTLAPGLVAIVDTPMFQFIGRVLGVPHNPGYPLYVLLTFPFSYLPIGSLPYRINLFSALCGAVTVGLAFAIARRLGCRRIVSAAAALGMAFGHIFWSQSIIAEVYTLDSMIIAGILLSLLVWRQARRPGFFYLAVALFAAGLGNHTTIVGFAPGIALYALLTDRRFALRARTLIVTTLIVAAGLLQYVFILVRSRQPGTYLESKATTVTQLIGVMSGRQFSNRLFAFEWRDVLVDRIPWLVSGILTPELTIPGLALGLFGLLWLLRRRTADGLLLFLGALAVAAFAVNYSVVDTPVFLIPTTMILWLGAGVGAEQLTRAVVAGRWSLVSGATLLLPLWLVATNFAVTDRSRDTSAAVAFDRLFDAVPDRTAFVHEDFLVDRLVMFKVLTDSSAGKRRFEIAPRNAGVIRHWQEDGFGIFGFRNSARRLRLDGLNFSYAPLPLIDGGLADVLARMPDDTIVAVAVPALHAERFLAARDVSFAPIGGPPAIADPPPAHVAVVGVRGARRGALVQKFGNDLPVKVAPGEQIGETGIIAPTEIEISGDGHSVGIRQSGRDLVRTAEGPAMAVWNALGEIEYTLVMESSNDFRAPVPFSALSVYPLRQNLQHVELAANTWTSFQAHADTGTVLVRLPSTSPVILYVGSPVPLAPRIFDRSSAQVTADITAFDRKYDPRRAERMKADDLPGGAMTEATYLYRVALQSQAREPAAAILALGGVPSHALGRTASEDASSGATVSPVDTRGLLRMPDRGSEVLLMARDDQAQLTGSGWSAVDFDPVTPYRWMTNTESRVLLPMAARERRFISVQALLEDGGTPASVRLHVDGVALAAQTLRPGWNRYLWALPVLDQRAAHDVTISVDRLTPSNGELPARGLAVAEVRVTH
jgi:hypothetical protein